MAQKNKNPSGASEDIARMAGTRFLSANEAEQGHRFDEPKVKALTGGDRIVARHLFKNSFEFTMQAKIWLRTNYKPDFRGQDEGIKRRMRLIPFDITIPKEKVDVNLSEKILKELPGILSWAVEGCLKWQKHGLQEPDIVLSATQNYIDEMDFIALFLGYYFVDGIYTEQKGKEFHEAYQEWAEETGKARLNLTGFGKRLTALGWQTKKKKGCVYRIPPKRVDSWENCLPNCLPHLEDSNSNDYNPIYSIPPKTNCLPHLEDSNSNDYNHLQRTEVDSGRQFSHNFPISKKRLPREDFSGKLSTTIYPEKKDVSESIANRGFETGGIVQKNCLPESTYKPESNNDSDSDSGVVDSWVDSLEDNSDYDLIL